MFGLIFIYTHTFTNYSCVTVEEEEATNDPPDCVGPVPLIEVVSLQNDEVLLQIVGSYGDQLIYRFGKKRCDGVSEDQLYYSCLVDALSAVADQKRQKQEGGDAQYHHD